MRPNESKMSVHRRKCKFFLLALLAISIGGCAFSEKRRSSSAKSNRPQQMPLGTTDSVASDEVLETPSSPTLIQPVGFSDGLIHVEVEIPKVAESEQIGAKNTSAADDVVRAEAIAKNESVDYFIELALTSHPSIRAAQQRVSAEANRMPQVRALPDPKFNNTFWPIHDQSLQTAAGRVGNQMSVSQVVPWPEKLRTKAAIVSQEIRVAQAEVDRIKREITESVRLAYYEVWFATRAIAIIEETQELINDLTKVAEARYRSGGTQQDVLRARLESDRLADQLVSLAKQKQVAQADLAALVQQPVTLLAEASDELSLANVPQQLDELISLAEQCNPKLAGLAWEIQRDRQKHRLACLQKYPDLQFGLNWGLVSDDSNVISPVANGHDQVNFNVGTTLPIWRNKINAGIREAANRTSSTAKRLDAERDALYGKLRRLLVQADAFTEQRDIYEKRIIPRTEDTLKLSIADYRGKRTDFFSLIETYRELLMFETQLARIDASLAGTIAQVERAVGCPR
ncbi:MAG: transporter [Rhodopirellula sp.]|nr:transporter [Rhodopirellula sp.]